MSGSAKGERENKAISIPDPENEVEALLRAAQDDLLLKLRVDSHPISSRSSSSFSAASDALNPDLAHRFEALKSPPPSGSVAAAPPPLPPPAPSKHVEKGAVAAEVTGGGDDEEWGRILGDDLAARFAALKGSSAGRNPGFQRPDLMPNLGDSVDEAGAGSGGGDGVSEKEVDKVIQWAMDAARLDPSKGDEDDDDVNGVNTDDDDKEEGEEDEEDVNEKKRKEMKKGKSKKWFFF